MNTSDNREYENVRRQYEDEAKEKWSNTDAYKESREKNSMSEGIDMSLLPPVQGTRFGRLFSLLLCRRDNGLNIQ